MTQFSRYVITGVLTLIPLWITWVVVEFVFRQLLKIGQPLVVWVRQTFGPWLPAMPQNLEMPYADEVLAVILTVLGFYILGRAVSNVVGARILSAFDGLMGRVPLVQRVYSGVKQLINALQQKPAEGAQRVVLIDFPSPEMKAVGLVTRVMTDGDTGQKLAIVYVPTTPNPTSGYLEVVPLDRVTPTQWTLDEAMNFVISAGAVAPDSITYNRPKDMPKPVPDKIETVQGHKENASEQKTG